MKKIAAITLSATFLLCNILVNAQKKSLSIPFGVHNSIVYDLQTGTYDVVVNGKTIVKNAYALCKGNAAYDSRLNTLRSFSAVPVHNPFGKGMLYTVTCKGETTLQQLFYVFRDRNYFLTATRLQAEACNYMSPLTADHFSTPVKGDNRVLSVPFDNDMWVRYNAAQMYSASFTGSEVTALYDNDSNNGVVIGSLEHTIWKSGIQVHGDSDTSLDRLSVFAGLSDSVITHDLVPHGKVQPVKGWCTSPLFVFGVFNDWRAGMETYTALNKTAEPRYIFSWNKPAPMGWNSWGAIQDKLTLDKAKGVIDFFYDSCKTFRTADHTLYIDLDAFWDYMVKGGMDGDLSQLKAFVHYCEQKGFQPGIYYAPFSDWSKTERKMEGSDYNYNQAWTMQRGKPVDIDGGRALDPTFPGTRARVIYYLNHLKELGFKMIKIDFLGHAAIEADHFYDSSVTTGMQAFRKGMELVDSVLNGSMLVYAAISPNLATARYVHTRRIGCDAFSAIDNTEYTLNSSGYGWWQGYLYDYIDADHVVFANGPENINRARLTSSLVTGTLITGDDYSIPGHWRYMAMTLLQNAGLLQLAQEQSRFRPVVCNTGNKGVQVFEKQEGAVTYIAIVNYEAQEKTFTIPLKRMGRKHASAQWQAKELFSGKMLQGKGDINITVAGSDAVIYKF